MCHLSFNLLLLILSLFKLFLDHFCLIVLLQMLRDEGITAGGNLIVLTDGDENDDATHHISTIGPQVQTQGVS